MTDFRIVVPHALVLLLALPIPMSSGAAEEAGQVAGRTGERPAPEADPAFLAMLGSAVTPARVASLSWILKAGDLPLLAVMRESGAPGSLRYEVAGIPLDVVIQHYDRLRVENARVALMPSADGRSCRFELSGSPFGETTKLEASGTVEWGTGPAGGDKLDVVFRLDDAPVEALRAFFPDRFDPSFRGNLDVHGKASGIVGEKTTEDMPATPLRGDLEASLDWQVLGRTAPLAIVTQFSVDDRMVRLRDGHLRWEGLELALKGWFDPMPKGNFDLAAGFTDVDTQKVATDWNVPEAWRPAAKLTGSITFKGKPGGGLMRYEARAPSVVVPALGGYTIRIDEPDFKGSLVAINADISASVGGTRVRIGDFELDAVPFGIQWWRDKLTVSTANTTMWDGENDGSASYKPATHPEFTISGRVKNAKAPRMAAGLVRSLGLDWDGASSLAFTAGQDAARSPYLSAHVSLLSGRLGGVDLFARVLEALAAADPALALPDAAQLVPRPRIGSGTRVDKLFFEIDRQAGVFEIGGLFLHADEFRLDGDGRYTPADGLRLEGTVAIPAAIASRLAASAPWLASLRAGDAPLFVPVVVAGTPASPTLALAPGYADLLARARRGEAVVAPVAKEVRHVGRDNLALIPADPSTPKF